MKTFQKLEFVPDFMSPAYGKEGWLNRLKSTFFHLRTQNAILVNQILDAHGAEVADALTTRTTSNRYRRKAIKMLADSMLENNAAIHRLEKRTIWNRFLVIGVVYAMMALVMKMIGLNSGGALLVCLSFMLIHGVFLRGDHEVLKRLNAVRENSETNWNWGTKLGRIEFMDVPEIDVFIHRFKRLGDVAAQIEMARTMLKELRHRLRGHEFHIAIEAVSILLRVANTASSKISIPLRDDELNTLNIAARAIGLGGYKGLPQPIYEDHLTYDQSR